MYRLWRYLVAVNYSSPFITLPAVGGGEGQTSYTKAVYDLFFANKRQEVLIMGGYGLDTNEVTKMIVEPNGTIRFEASTPMLQGRTVHDAVYHQGEVLSVSAEFVAAAARGTMERLDTLTQTRTLLAERLPNNLHYTTAAVLDNKLLAIGGNYRIAGHLVFSDIVYELDEHASQAGQGRWRTSTAKLSMARRSAAAITFKGKTFVCGGRGVNSAVPRSAKAFDPATGAWQIEDQQMTKERIFISLFVLQEELYAVGGDGIGHNTSIEKRNKVTKQWEHVTNCGQKQYACAAALVGSKVFLFGGRDYKSTFDYFDLDSKKWASQTKGKYKKESARQLPRQVYFSKAVLITPSAALAKEWTDVNVVKLEDRDTTRYNERFEAVTGKGIQWDASRRSNEKEKSGWGEKAEGVFASIHTRQTSALHTNNIFVRARPPKRTHTQ